MTATLTIMRMKGPLMVADWGAIVAAGDRGGFDLDGGGADDTIDTRRRPRRSTPAPIEGCRLLGGIGLSRCAWPGPGVL